MAARHRHGSDDGQSKEYIRARPSAAAPGASNAVLINTPDIPESLDQVTDSLELARGQQELWEEIYKLGGSGVERYIELPQIIVVGDQSSGKSSVLEAITGVHFPRNSGMCTKFPTQINLRKAAQESRSVRLEPEPNRTAADRERFARFSREVHRDMDLGEIIKLAEKTIWPSGQSANSASKDTLILDFSGPKKDYLTLVDLPGIIHTSAGNAMGDEDVKAIRELAIDYMKNPRSIILAVIKADNDLNLQVILNHARTIDPNGTRTLGVITKPDRIDSPESEAMFIKLARNEIVKFDLGWHVLRNRSNDPEEKNCPSSERDRIEKQFFETSNWQVLDKNNRGIDALRTRMSKLLLQRFAKVIPHVVSQIEQRLNACKKDLSDLGEEYGDVSQMRTKMREWCKQSSDFVHNAATGHYRDSRYSTSFFDSEARDAHIRKLRARIHAENLLFEEALRTTGHTVEITDIDLPYSNGKRSRADRVDVPRRMTTAEFIEKCVDPVIQKSSGQELLGDSDPLLVYELFKTHSQNWDKLAKRHLDTIHGFCEEFLVEILYFFWPSTIQQRVRTALIEDELESRHRDANSEVKKLCKDRCRCAKSYDQEYTNLMKKWERKFMESGSNLKTETFHPLTQAENYLARLLAYYEVSLKVFMSNVIVQVIERHLVDCLEEIFDSAKVHDMKDEKVKAIFEEEEHIRESRARLQAERASLEAGLKSARRLAARKDLKVYGRAERDLLAPQESPISPKKGTSINTAEVVQDHPDLPSRPTVQPETPRERRSTAIQQLDIQQLDREPVRHMRVAEDTITTYPSPSPRTAPTRSPHYYQQAQQPPSPEPQTSSYPQHVERRRSPEYYTASPTQSQYPPPVPPHPTRNQQPMPGTYGSSGQDVYTDSREKRRR